MELERVVVVPVFCCVKCILNGGLGQMKVEPLPKQSTENEIVVTAYCPTHDYTVVQQLPTTQTVTIA